jgi:hypothetical protein
MGIRVGGRTSGSEIRSNRQSSPSPHIHGKKQNKPKRKKKKTRLIKNKRKAGAENNDPTT